MGVALSLRKALEKSDFLTANFFSTMFDRSTVKKPLTLEVARVRKIEIFWNT